MKYVHWANRKEYPLISRLGFGTTKFIQEDLKDQNGFNRCIELVEYAIEKGINYFDVAPTYSNGMAEKILGTAFNKTDKPIYIAAKSGLMIDKTSDDVLKRIDNSIDLLKRDKLDFYHIWSVMNWQQYTEVCKAGGILEGVLKAKDMNLIDHVCISLHCNPETTLKIMDDGIFEGITISMNVLNYQKWEKVLDVAREKNIAVATMNSLAGGIIPKYEQLFCNLDSSNDSISIKALRFLLHQKGVTIALSGMPTKDIIDENCYAVDHMNDVPCNELFTIPVSETLCSGCNYCTPCTVGIPISSCLQAYNHRILVQASEEECSNQRIANEVFIKARANGVDFPNLNTCIECNICEQRCTQKIHICERIKWLETESKTYGYTHNAMRKRLHNLELKCANSSKIAIWPAADYASKVLDYWKNDDFENRCVFVNESSAMWGKTYRNSTILSPDALEKEDIDTIVIMHYRLQKDIYKIARKKYPNKNVVCLHEDTDIDWFQWFTR